MSKNLLFYSVNSFLSYMINETYYNGEHYVWVAPSYNVEDNPPSSNPAELYSIILNDVTKKDNHSSFIKRNKIGILNGAEQKFEEKVITLDEKNEIITILDKSDISDYRPLLYIIPSERVNKLIKRVDLMTRASPFSKEFKIENLKRIDFDIIEF